MTFAEDLEAAIAEFATEQGISREEAIALIIRDWAIGYGLIPIDADED